MSDARDTIDTVLYQRYGSGESLVWIAEECADDKLQAADPALYEALKSLDDAAAAVCSRMTELNKKYDLGYED